MRHYVTNSGMHGLEFVYPSILVPLRLFRLGERNPGSRGLLNTIGSNKPTTTAKKIAKTGHYGVGLVDDLFLQQLLDEERDGDASAFLIFLKDEGLELLAAYRAIEDEDVRAALRKLIFNIAFGSHRGSGDDGPVAA